MEFLHTASLDLVSFVDRPPSEYAVFSHSRDPSRNEPHGRVSSMGAVAGRFRCATCRSCIAQACRQAQARGIPYLWPGCLGDDRAAEPAAVTASFRLVWGADLCIAHLPDLPPAAAGADSLADLEAALPGCRWFTRAWALQDLVAARRLEMYDGSWTLRGVKAPASPRPWLEMLSRASGIDVAVLADRDALFDVSLGRRLSWAASRSADRPEDAAYALAGLCGVAGRLAPRYGEGGRSAFTRLQEAILETTTDLSILAWERREDDEDDDDDGDGGCDGRRRLLHCILAGSAADFGHFASRPSWGAPFASDCELTFSNRGLCARGLLSARSHRPAAGREVVLLLNASWHTQPGAECVGLTLTEVEPGLFVRASARAVVRLPLRYGDVKPGRICIRRGVSSRDARHTDAERNAQRVSAWVDDLPGREPDPRWGPPALQGPTPPANTAGAQPAALDPRGRCLPKRDADTMLDDDGGRASDEEQDDDDDVLRFDSLPEKPGRLEADHPFRSLLPTLVAAGLDAWDAEKTAATTAATASAADAATAGAQGAENRSLSLGPLTMALRPRKRARWDGGGDPAGSCAAETDGSEPDLCMVRARGGRYDLLACPLYRSDPGRHRSCMWELELPDARTVKQHLIVDHRVPEHCPVCYDVFDRARDRDRHIVARACCQRDPPPGLLAGVSEDQVEALSRRGPRAGTAAADEAEWFRVWRLLFPGAPPPASARLWRPREREAAALRRFWREAGPALVAAALDDRSLLRWDDPQEEAALAALHASVLEGMVERSGLVAEDTEA